MINKVWAMIMSALFLLIGVYLFFNIGPALLGMSITAANTGYISNTTGCYVDTAGTASDVPVNSIYCMGFTLFPILMVVGFFVAMISLVILYIKGVINF